MEGKIDADVLSWYRQFVHSNSEIDDHTSPNFLTRIVENDINSFEDEFGKILPGSYLMFLKLIGHGRIRQDINGKFSENYDNSFLDVSEIAEILRKDSAYWEVYPDFIGDEEVPFFDLGNNSVLVFRKNEGSSVYFPYLNEKYSDSFEEFLLKIMNDCTFYKDI